MVSFVTSSTSTYSTYNSYSTWNSLYPYSTTNTPVTTLPNGQPAFNGQGPVRAAAPNLQVSVILSGIACVLIGALAILL